MERITVVKVGGNELDDPAFLAGLSRAVAAFGQPLVLVHGGGREITAALDAAGLPVQFIEGLRVTSPEAMAIMQQVVCGTINKRVVTSLLQVGVRALGLSGLDLGLLRCEPHRPAGADLGRVGLVTAVETPAIHAMLAQGWLPVFAPVALGAADGLSYNVNADMVAQALAAALPGAELLFISNVPGVLIDGEVAPDLDVAATDAAIASTAIHGGMVPKVRAALAALEAGAASARITNLAGFATGGTRFRG
ncbi:MAG: acetylglutamate kinase [Candidatus Viridilinea halotolerans]|uniref:Acetylglutamate kinase n=1 Tax=Candidatus Viridilinea halotolerans TaxID=2491704 RepID=A0A426TSF9_9CHLR|nr:MAG: acetylglutamate kinase [Candidatus Viridilinea halotolerans]